MNDNNQTGGVGFLGLLTILFIGLKLTDNIDWSWTWVFSPLWIPIVCLLVLALVFAGLGTFLNKR